MTNRQFFNPVIGICVEIIYTLAIAGAAFLLCLVLIP